MLRRRDLKGQDENTSEQQAQDAPAETTATQPASETQANPAANANISPGGLAWRPMRQQNEEWRTQRPSAGATGEESIIGPDDFFNGNYKSERGVRVQGRVEGAVESKGHILIEEQAQVSADMSAEDITVAGRYNGKVECRRRFEITPTGIVTGEINTDLLVVQEGGYFDGKLKMKERSNAGRVSPSQRGAGQPAPTPDEEQTPAQV
jgi:cytoskeletal protein CcmA (bactofilin family)